MQKGIFTRAEGSLQKTNDVVRAMLEINEEKPSFIQAEIDRLRQEHRDLDAAIETLSTIESIDQLQLQRLKKRRLVLRDKISFLDDQIFPDIIA